MGADAVDTARTQRVAPCCEKVLGAAAEPCGRAQEHLVSVPHSVRATGLFAAAMREQCERAVRGARRQGEVRFTCMPVSIGTGGEIVRVVVWLALRGGASIAALGRARGGGAGSGALSLSACGWCCHRECWRARAQAVGEG